MMALVSYPQNRRISRMSANISKGRIPYVSQLIHDFKVMHHLGVKIRHHPRLFDGHADVTMKLKRKYPPRFIWVTASRSGVLHVGWRFWSQHVK
jgi:hypothetical protein